MAQAHVERKLTAILSTDVAGFSRLMGHDEVWTAQTLDVSRNLIRTQVVQHGGRVVDAVGDNLLADFPSAMEAVRCAVAIQQAFAELQTLDRPPTLFLLDLYFPVGRESTPKKRETMARLKAEVETAQKKLSDYLAAIGQDRAGGCACWSKCGACIGMYRSCSTRGRAHWMMSLPVSKPVQWRCSANRNPRPWTPSVISMGSWKPQPWPTEIPCSASLKRCPLPGAR